MASYTPLVLVNNIPANIPAGGVLSVPVTSQQIDSLLNGESTATLTIGMPVYISAAGTVKRAQANAFSTAGVIGLVYDVSITAGAVGNITFGPTLTATTTQWDAVVTGESGGLTFGAYYFLDPSNPGKMVTTTISAGNVVTLVGKALSTTQMQIIQSTPIQI